MGNHIAILLFFASQILWSLFFFIFCFELLIHQSFSLNLFWFQFPSVCSSLELLLNTLTKSSQLFYFIFQCDYILFQPIFIQFLIFSNFQKTKLKLKYRVWDHPKLKIEIWKCWVSKLLSFYRNNKCMRIPSAKT